MTAYRITARDNRSGVVVYCGVLEAGSRGLAEEHAGVVWPQYGVSWVFRAEPQLVRWPTLGKPKESAA